MDAPFVVGVGFLKQQGKDTFASLLAARLAESTEVFLTSFAAALKDELNEAYAIPAPLLWGGEEERAAIVQYDGRPVTVREALQEHGMRRRAEDPDHWVKCVRAAVPAGTRVLVVSDVRFRNELEMTDAAYAVFRSDPSLRPDPHISENTLEYSDPMWTELVDNTGPMPALEAEADRVAADILARLR